MTKEQYEVAKADMIDRGLKPFVGASIEERDYFPSDRPAYRYFVLCVPGAIEPPNWLTSPLPTTRT